MSNLRLAIFALVGLFVCILPALASAKSDLPEWTAEIQSEESPACLDVVDDFSTVDARNECEQTLSIELQKCLNEQGDEVDCGAPQTSMLEVDENKGLLPSKLMDDREDYSDGTEIRVRHQWARGEESGLIEHAYTRQDPQEEPSGCGCGSQPNQSRGVGGAGLIFLFGLVFVRRRQLETTG